jgi:hypothetical protein
VELEGGLDLERFDRVGASASGLTDHQGTVLGLEVVGEFLAPGEGVAAGEYTDRCLEADGGRGCPELSGLGLTSFDDVLEVDGFVAEQVPARTSATVSGVPPRPSRRSMTSASTARAA